LTIRQLESGVLTEQTCYMTAGRRQGVVQGGRNYQFDNRFAAPSMHSSIAVGAIHIGEAWRQDDAGCVMVSERMAGQRFETGQF
jgi:hypothetical protein